MRLPSTVLAVSALGCATLLGVAAVPRHHAAAVQETAATAYTVTLQATGGQFVSAAYGGGGTVGANRARAAGWETFTLSDLNGGALTSGDLVYLGTANGHYLSAQWGGGAAVDAPYTHHLSWETFRISAGDGGAVRNGTRIALQTQLRGRWVSAAKTTGGALTAVAATVGAQQTFTLGLRGTAAPTPTPAPTTAVPVPTPTSTKPAPPPTAAPTPTTAPTATGFVYPAPGQRTGPGVLPAAVASTRYLGPLVYDSPIVRDLGFSGVVNGQSVWTFGDTLVQSGSDFPFAASDSVAIGDPAHPTVVHDKHVNASGWPLEWIPLTTAEQANGGLGRYAEGGTNVVEYGPNKGLVWFLKNDRGSGGKGILGAGVATVTADANGAVATRGIDTMWGADEPYWGDVGVTYDQTDHDVYVYGHGPTGFGNDTYLARVPADRATDVSAYEYWDQSTKTWGTQRLTLGGANGTRKISTDQALFTYAAVGQSNAFWSNHYNTWMFVYGAGWPNSDIYVMTAPALQGPWSKPVSVGTTCPTGSCGNFRYATEPHPEYDPTGQTLLVTWTDQNRIFASRLTWR